MPQMESESTGVEQAPKKGRHRKKQLYNSILQQMEFYFSDSNLTKDRFLSQLIQEDPWIDLTTFLKFNKIRKLTLNIEDIRKAVSKSELLELSEDRNKIRRKTPLKAKPNVEDCTIYVEHIKSDTNHEWLTSAFSEFGNVVYVSIPKYRHNHMNKGFAFIEFENESGAKNALDYFESIDCKISSQLSPEELQSIATFEGDSNTENDKDSLVDKDTNAENVEENKSECPVEVKEKSHNKKRKLSSDKIEVTAEKKVKTHEGDTECRPEVEENVQNSKRKLNSDKSEGAAEKEAKADESGAKAQTEVKENVQNTKRKLSSDESDGVAEKKGKLDKSDSVEDKKKNKKVKKKCQFKEMGLQILSKKEWKKMRNRYLDMQKKKMKELKQHLHRAKYARRVEDTHANPADMNGKPTEEEGPKIEYTPNVIVKVRLSEPCHDIKKTKADIKTRSQDIQFVEAALGNDNAYVRFANSESAEKFCSSGFGVERNVLQGEDEKQYWEKIRADRMAKFKKNNNKQRGRDKLLKKAEKQLGKHIRFDDTDD